jgi:hypothetical protein
VCGWTCEGQRRKFWLDRGRIYTSVDDCVLHLARLDKQSNTYKQQLYDWQAGSFRDEVLNGARTSLVHWQHDSFATAKPCFRMPPHQFPAAVLLWYVFYGSRHHVGIYGLTQRHEDGKSHQPQCAKHRHGREQQHKMF